MAEDKLYKIETRSEALFEQVRALLAPAKVRMVNYSRRTLLAAVDEAERAQLESLGAAVSPDAD